MIVSKCDRCGVYIDKDIIPKIRGAIYPDAIAPNKEDIKMDICYECYYELRRFLKLEENKK